MKTKREYRQNILLTETKNLPKVKSFLDTVATNNSPRSADIYLIGLAYFQTFLKEKKNMNLETILKPLEKNKIDKYELFQEFINSLNGNLKPRSVKSYLTGVRVYLGTHKIYLEAREYKYRVREPKIKINRKEPLDPNDITKILLECSNKRLKAFLFVIATGGSRARETISIRLKDIDFNSVPTKINLRAEFTKTGEERYFFITDEATTQLKNWIEWKYRKRDNPANNLERRDTDYVFAVYNTRNPNHEGIYKTLSDEFNTLLASLAMDQRKEGMTRRQITFHDFRTFVYSIVSDLDYNYAEWLLGHKHSTYWQKKLEDKKQKYLEYQKYLRFIQPLQNLGRDIESKMKEKDTQMQLILEQLRELQKFRLDTLEKNKKSAEDSISILKQAIKENIEEEGRPEMTKILQDKKTRAERKKEQVIQQITRINKTDS